MKWNVALLFLLSLLCLATVLILLIRTWRDISRGVDPDRGFNRKSPLFWLSIGAPIAIVICISAMEVTKHRNQRTIRKAVEAELRAITWPEIEAALPWEESGLEPYQLSNVVFLKWRTNLNSFYHFKNSYARRVNDLKFADVLVNVREDSVSMEAEVFFWKAQTNNHYKWIVPGIDAKYEYAGYDIVHRLGSRQWTEKAMREIKPGIPHFDIFWDSFNPEFWETFKRQHPSYDWVAIGKQRSAFTQGIRAARQQVEALLKNLPNGDGIAVRDNAEEITMKIIKPLKDAMVLTLTIQFRSEDSRRSFGGHKDEIEGALSSAYFSALKREGFENIGMIHFEIDPKR